MGFSHSSKSGKTLDALISLLQQGTNQQTSNTWTVQSGDFTRSYFYEVDRKDQPDNGLRGEVHEMTVGGNCRFSGTFHITGEGTIRSFPGTTPKQQREAEANANAPRFRESTIARV